MVRVLVLGPAGVHVDAGGHPDPVRGDPVVVAGDEGEVGAEAAAVHAVGGGDDEVALGGVDHSGRAVVVAVPVGAGGEEGADRGLGGRGTGLQRVGGLPSGRPPVRRGVRAEGLVVRRRLRVLPGDPVEHGGGRPVGALRVLLVAALRAVPFREPRGVAVQLPGVPQASEEQRAEDGDEQGDPYGPPANLAEHVWRSHPADPSDLCSMGERGQGLHPRGVAVLTAVRPAPSRVAQPPTAPR